MYIVVCAPFAARRTRARDGVALTPNFLKPFILSSGWSCISTSECAEASSEDGSWAFAALFRGMLPSSVWWAARRHD